MIKDQLHGAQGESNCREKGQHDLGSKLKTNHQCGSRQGHFTRINVSQDNKCDERSFSQNKAEDGEEGNNKPSPQQPIDRTQGLDDSDYSKKKNPKQS